MILFCFIDKKKLFLFLLQIDLYLKVIFLLFQFLCYNFIIKCKHNELLLTFDIKNMLNIECIVLELKKNCIQSVVKSGMHKTNDTIKYQHKCLKLKNADISKRKYFKVNK